MQNLNKTPLFVFASARKNGNTWKAMIDFIENRDHEIIDLIDYNIEHFAYEKTNNNDDFQKVLNKITQHQKVVFATPVYWYSMSARLKVFFERLTGSFESDQNLKDVLKKLKIYVLYCFGNDKGGSEGFEESFKRISNYLNLNYKGGIPYCVKKEIIIKKDNTENIYNNYRKSIWDIN